MPEEPQPQSSEQPPTDAPQPQPEVTDLEVAQPKSKAAAMIQFGEMPTTLEQAWIAANVYAKSSLVPDAYRQKPHNVLVAWDMARRLGLGPFAALQSIAVINGRPGVWGDGFLAICQSSPRYKDHDEYYLV